MNSVPLPWFLQDRSVTTSQYRPENLVYRVCQTTGDLAVAIIQDVEDNREFSRVPSPIACSLSQYLTVCVGDLIRPDQFFHVGGLEACTADQDVATDRGILLFSELCITFEVIPEEVTDSSQVGLLVTPPSPVKGTFSVMIGTDPNPVDLLNVFWPICPSRALPRSPWLTIDTTTCPTDAILIEHQGIKTGYIPLTVNQSCPYSDGGLADPPEDRVLSFISRVRLLSEDEIDQAFPDKPLHILDLAEIDHPEYFWKARLAPLRLRQYFLQKNPETSTITGFLGVSDDPTVLTLQPNPTEKFNQHGWLVPGKLVKLSTEERTIGTFCVQACTPGKLGLTIYRIRMPKDRPEVHDVNEFGVESWIQLDSSQVEISKQMIGLQAVSVQPASEDNLKTASLTDYSKVAMVLEHPKCRIHRYGDPCQPHPLPLLAVANLWDDPQPKEQVDPSRLHFDESLNAEQQRAVQEFCNIPSCVVLQAPAGTGKTRTLANAAAALHRLEEKKMVIIATLSNEAVRNAEEAVLATGVPSTDVLTLQSSSAKLRKNQRQRNSSSTSTLNHMVRLEASGCQLSIGFRDLLKSHKRYTPSPTDETLMGRMVLEKQKNLIVIGTVSMIQRLTASIHNEIAGILLDEAGMVTSTEIFGLLCGLEKPVHRLLAAGDLMQLNCPLPAPIQCLEKYGLKSLLSTLLGHSHQSIKKICLKITYRFAPRLASLISTLCYADELQWPLGRIEDPGFAATMPNMSAYAPVGFLHVNGVERKVGTSWSNTNQILVAVELVELMFMEMENLRRGNKSVMVLVPYQAALRETQPLLRELQEKYHRANIISGTVDQLQGREADYAIYVTIKSLPSNAGPSFATLGQRVTVALTRGRDGLYVIGSRPYIKACSYELAQLLDLNEL
ncbi:unnamed protein product [Bursaphelenchus xylophilus]|uniref:(pine wood nematode) hypothetical protein n=1 Tax=Bursaphelenchus xylophilus TaxID=6326 RepID=A0A1I7S4N9_BURXY|nr:unnamed protein product [Bursaphelenchus xylophilus]CAG9117264.1 unnamed protein product [Bursaphelenchus xylophilus]